MKQATLAASSDPAESANPLWAIPIDGLSQTRERPLFSPSRRQPAPPIVISPPPPSMTLPKAGAAQDRPGVVLVGTVLGQQSMAILRADSTEVLVRLRVGQDHEGWTLRSVAKREVTLERRNDTAILKLSASPPEQMLRVAASTHADAITRFALPSPQPDPARRCMSGLTARPLPSDSIVCAVGRGRALIRSSRQ